MSQDEEPFGIQIVQRLHPALLPFRTCIHLSFIGFHINHNVAVVRITSQMVGRVRHGEEVGRRVDRKADSARTIFSGRIFLDVLSNQVEVLIQSSNKRITEFLQHRALNPECALPNFRLRNVSDVSGIRQDIDMTVAVSHQIKVRFIYALDVRTMLLDQVIQRKQCTCIEEFLHIVRPNR